MWLESMRRWLTGGKSGTALGDGEELPNPASLPDPVPPLPRRPRSRSSDGDAATLYYAADGVPAVDAGHAPCDPGCADASGCH